ncbi:MAG: 4a-hydroxytetrahydrobiopterin dehydratase [Ignavibacteriae bacterium HGW-Ignavibacteriae-3]|nr:MAG: 4a-hydroxytetrahydrobiopterin dehydratase [Ignavibacteriae bacterium HGW-Ignavibacteriae-3]
MNVLSPEEISNKIESLNGWFFLDNSISKEFKLKSFADAVAFLVKVSFEAEKLDHHPDLLLHSWNKLKITLSTHSKGGVTDNDFSLAQTIDSIRQ